jgi:MinD superfamily P-loop ATPase
MKLAVASGKGGTGKTTVATNLAWVAGRRGHSVAYVDCDVEEPNGHLFLKPQITATRAIGRLHPQVDAEKCTGCGLCGEICQYSAIVCLGPKVLVYPELCHACGGCTLVCQPGAITEVVRETGRLEAGSAGPIRFVHGVLNIGDAMSTPLIRQVKQETLPQDWKILDCPPGTSCPVIESVRGADLVLLVTEPTPFGLNDLQLAVEMIRALHLPFVVAVNRAGVGDRQTQQYCRQQGIQIVAEIPDDRRVAEAYSEGRLACEVVPEFRSCMEELLDRLGAADRIALPNRPTANPRPASYVSNNLVAAPPDHLVTLNPEPIPRVKQIAVVSGKGGTGKTSLVASFAALAHDCVLADCDVDAADLHLLLQPRVLQREPFSGGKRARIEQDKCNSCGKCLDLCRFGAIRCDDHDNENPFQLDPVMCEGCGVCAWFCPERAIEFGPVVNGEWLVSETRFGPMVHAKLGVAAENSGKLVTMVRSNAKRVAEERGLSLLLIDGSPGIGCPVIASITGADLVVVVTEPTLSGLHDLERVADLTRHFGIPAMVCINKWDLNAEISNQIEVKARKRGLSLAGRIRYDRAVTEAQVQRRTIVEYRQDGSATEIRSVWAQVLARIRNGAETAAAPISRPQVRSHHVSLAPAD